MQRRLAKFLLTATLGIGFSLGSASILPAADYAPQGPQTPSRPSTTPLVPQPSETTTPSTEAPSALPSSSEAAAAATPAAAPGEAAGAESADMLGRMDSAARFNLFDTMAAAPVSRVWFNTQWADGYHPSLQPLHGSSPDGEDFKNEQWAYRAGLEVALSDRFSVAAQGQYIQEFEASGVNAPTDGFTNPEVMAKYALIREQGTIVSAILGCDIQIDGSRHENNENTWRILPGALFYQDVSDNLFVQGGFQFGLPTGGGKIYSADWALSAGYWLCGGPCQHGQSSGLITGFAPQVEVLGHHVLGNNQILGAYDDPTGVLVEGRNIIDGTIGATMLLGEKIWVGAGVSTHLTGGASVRNLEAMTSVGYRF